MLIKIAVAKKISEFCEMKEYKKKASQEIIVKRYLANYKVKIKEEK